MASNEQHSSVIRFVNLENATFLQFVSQLTHIYHSLRNRALQSGWVLVIQSEDCDGKNWWFRVCKVVRNSQKMVVSKSEWRKFDTYYAFGAMKADLQTSMSDGVCWVEFWNVAENPTHLEKMLNDRGIMHLGHTGIIELLQVSSYYEPTTFPLSTSPRLSNGNSFHHLIQNLQHPTDLVFGQFSSDSPLKVAPETVVTKMKKPVRYYHGTSPRGPVALRIPLLPSGGVTYGWPRIPTNEFGGPVEFGSAPLIPTDAYPVLGWWLENAASAGARLVPWEEAAWEPKGKGGSSVQKEKRQLGKRFEIGEKLNGKRPSKETTVV